MQDMNSFSTPINKTAALVTQQPPACDLEDLAQQRVAAIDACAFWNRQKLLGVVGAEEKLLEVIELTKSLKHKVKVVKNALNEDFNSYLANECKKRFTKKEWAVIIFKAREQWASELEGEL